MNALLLMAHGSPRPEANDDVRRVAAVLRERGAYGVVVIGYLDCNQPDLPAAIDECVAAGAGSIVAVPYLLHSGKHFLFDMPALLEDGMRRHAGLAITMGDYIGREPQLASVLWDRVRAVR